jgi:hypothetical protein
MANGGAGAAGRSRAAHWRALAASDPVAQTRLAAFLQVLKQLGWTDGRYVQIDIRWSTGNAAKTLKDAAELVALAPDIIFTKAARASRRYSKQLELSLSYSQSFPIRSVPVSSRACRSQVATPQDL